MRKSQLRHFGAMFGLLALFLPFHAVAQQTHLCIDGFCIGQDISDGRFGEVEWIIPKKDLVHESCLGIGCRPDVEFPGYEPELQRQLANAVSWTFSLNKYNLVTKTTLPALRQYKYDCTNYGRGTLGERRFFGAFLSIPSGYLTIVGLRLIQSELRVYRIARQYPYRTPNELVALARQLQPSYPNILFYNYLSSNAYSEVISQRKDGWFGRSTMFNPVDPSDNTAELVLIDPATRPLLQPTSMPESGDIQPLPGRVPPQCSRQLPLQ
jgi:hypothetical protein